MILVSPAVCTMALGVAERERKLDHREWGVGTAVITQLHSLRPGACRDAAPRGKMGS